MLIKLIVKLWPSFIPVISYLFWVFIIEGIVLKKLLRKKDVIKGEKIVGEKTTKAKKISRFSLNNRHFVIIVYLSLILAIVSLIFSAFSEPKNNKTYIPASYENGKIIPSTIQ